jgi:hypothetical protein
MRRWQFITGPGVANRGAGAAGGDTGYRVSRSRVARKARENVAAVQRGLSGAGYLKAGT